MIRKDFRRIQIELYYIFWNQNYLRNTKCLFYSNLFLAVILIIYSIAVLSNRVISSTMILITILFVSVTGMREKNHLAVTN